MQAQAFIAQRSNVGFHLHHDIAPMSATFLNTNAAVLEARDAGLDAKRALPVGASPEPREMPEVREPQSAGDLRAAGNATFTGLPGLTEGCWKFGTNALDVGVAGLFRNARSYAEARRSGSWRKCLRQKAFGG